MPTRNINNLEDLLAEKARLRAQIRIVETEMAASADRTREQLSDFVENKFSISKQIGQLFQSDTQTAAGASVIGTVGRAIGIGPLWNGILTTLGPVLVNYYRKQMAKRRERNTSEPPVSDVVQPTKKSKADKEKLDESAN